MKKSAKWYSPIFQDRWLMAIIALAILLGVFYNGVLLLAHDVDESRHMEYVKLLLDERRLPLILSTSPYAEYRGAHAFHPPLYYLVLLPFYLLARVFPGDIGWHLLRVLSLLMCLAALPLIYQIALAAAPKRKEFEGENETENSGTKFFARLVTAQIALLPMFGMTAGMINNDSGCFLAVTVFLWLLIVKYPHDRSFKSAVVLGIVWGLGALTKSTALLCGGVAMLLYLAAQDGRSALFSSRAWMRFGIACFCLMAIAGWWHIRSLQLYGSFMPLPPAMPLPQLPSPNNGVLVMMLHDNFPQAFTIANWGLFSTLWSQKDWIPESVRDPIYWLLALYCVIAIAGFAFSTFQNRRENKIQNAPVLEAAKNDETARRIALWTTYGVFIANWLTILQVALFWHWGWAEGGRYLLPALCGLSILLARGWCGFVNKTALKYLTAVWFVALLGLNVLSLYWLITFLNPTFG